MGKVIRRGEEARQKAIDILRNGGSLDDAAAATGYGRDYVRQLGVKEGIRYPRGKYGPRFDRELILSLYRQGYSAKEASRAVGCSTSLVCNVWNEAGLERQLTPLQQKVKALRDQGKVSSEIREELGINHRRIKTIVETIGVPFTEEEKKRSFALAQQKARITQGRTEDGIRKRAEKHIRENFPDWEYVSGGIGGGQHIKLKCKTCGEIITRDASCVRTKGSCPRCPKCHEKRLAEKERAREQEQKRLYAARQEKRRRKFWDQDFKQIAFKACPECGSVHIERGAYCSEKCQKKALNRHHDKRIDRASVIDKSITLEKLYKRDKGICWICGGKCDWNDFHVDANGNFIVGESYPTKDHVYPLAKGGDHTWNNVKLAHWLCNTIKRDRVVS